MVRKRKGNLLQRIMASLLSAVLIAGMALEAVPLAALAQEMPGGGYNLAEESVVENPVTEEAAEPESKEKESIPESGEGAQESDGEKKEVDPATEKTEDTEEPGETKKPVENPAAEGQDGVSEQESSTEEEGTDITDSNGVQPEKPAAPQKAVRAARAAVQAEEITPVTGEGWAIDKDGKLTIESDAGMDNWGNYKEGSTNPHKSSVNTVEINEAVTYLANNAFSQCENLSSVAIPNSVTSIGRGALSHCKSLTSINVPAGVQRIEDGTFAHCKSLPSIDLPDSVTSIGSEAFWECGSLAEIEIPSGVTSIGKTAFRECTGLTQIKIPSGVTSIEENVFYRCTGLQDIDLPDGVTSIGDMAFYECSSLMSVKLPDSVTGIGDMAFDTCSGLKSIIIPAGVESIAPGLFAYCTALEDITLPDGVTSIGEGAFIECTSLTNIEIPDKVTSIGSSAFNGCTNLTGIAIPSSAADVGHFAFLGCSSLTEITIPSGVTDMGSYTFYGCTSLTKVTMQGTKPPTLEIVDEETGATEVFTSCKFVEENIQGITVPLGTLEAYQTAWPEWKDYIVEDSAPDTPTDKDKLDAAKNAVEKALADIEVSNTTTQESLAQAIQDAVNTALQAAGIDSRDVTVAVENFAKKEATTGVAGSITANITINSGTESANVPVEKVIEKLPGTPADKVEAAKKAVEAALKDIKVSNTTTKEDIEKAITEAVKSALEAAGIDSKDVTVEVKDFVKTEATTEAAGSITADITITSGGESAGVPVNQPIDKLPSTPADQVAAVKKAVEEALQDAIDKALAGTTVTNENAQEIAAKITELIPDAVAKAFEAAGVGMDDIAVGELAIQIDPADADKEGSIQVTIPLTSNADASLSESASVQVPVMKPGGEENPGQEAEAAKKAVEEALKNIPVTNETTPEDILAALKEALGEDVAVEGIDKFEKTDATEETPGKISLSIRIIINGKTVIVNVDADIAQPARKTGVYVRFIDAYQMEGNTPVYKYTGLAIKPAVEVYNNETLLTLGKDYTLGYKNNTKPGTAAALTVRGKGSHAGTSNAVNFHIINADIKNDTDHPTEMTVIQNTKVSPVIMNGTKKLTTKDYELEGEGLVNSKYAAPTAEGETKTLTVKGKGSYAGSSFEIQVKVIERKAAGKLSVKVDSKFKPVYDGTALHLSSLFRKPQEGEGTETAAEGQEPAGVITVTDAKDKTKILKEGTDFTVVCTSSLTNAGTVKFTLTGMGAYTGSVAKSFKISPHKVTDSSRFSVTFDEAKTYEYRAAGTEVDGLLVKYLGETEAETDDKILIPGVDYKVTYSNHKKVSGTKDAGLKVTFLGNYKGSSAVQKTFKIAPAKLSSANTVVTVPDKVYIKGNRAYKSTPIVTVDGAVIKSSQYTVSYEWATASQAADDTKYVKDDRVKITIAEGDTWAKVRVTVTPKEKGSYGLAEGAVLRGEYYVRKADQAVNLTKAKVTFFDKEGTQLRWLAYNGNTFYTPAGNNAEAENAPDGPNAVYVRVTVSGAVVDPTLYEVTWTNATAKGKATVVIRGTGTATDKGMAVGSKNQSVTIKAMALKGKTLKSYVEGMADVMNSLKDLFF